MGQTPELRAGKIHYAFFSKYPLPFLPIFSVLISWASYVLGLFASLLGVLNGHIWFLLTLG